MPRHFDKSYFDTWYRHPKRRVKSSAEVTREADFVLHAAERILGRAVRSVLDVGCGEGHWSPLLKRHRPSLRYVGVDPSDYAVARWGRRRNIHLGSITTLSTLGLRGPFDLIISCGVLNYLAAPDLKRGLSQLQPLLGGVAYLELYTNADAVTGDTRGAARHPATWYRRALRHAGLVPCGMHLYANTTTADTLAELEHL